MTTAGLFATVVSVSDTEVELEVAPGVVSTYARAAIARVVTPERMASTKRWRMRAPICSEEDDR